MRRLDKFIRYLRVSKVLSEIDESETVIDLGGYDFYLLSKCKGKYHLGILIDPLAEDHEENGLISIKGDLFYAIDKLQLQPNSVDVIFMLSVFEHLGNERNKIISECRKLLKKGGKIILTIPHPMVDYILLLLKFGKLIDGMSLEQHDGYNQSLIHLQLNTNNFIKLKHKKFQLGLNNLYVFEKI